MSPTLENVPDGAGTPFTPGPKNIEGGIPVDNIKFILSDSQGSEARTLADLLEQGEMSASEPPVEGDIVLTSGGRDGTRYVIPATEFGKTTGAWQALCAYSNPKLPLREFHEAEGEQKHLPLSIWGVLKKHFAFTETGEKELTATALAAAKSPTPKAKAAGEAEEGTAIDKELEARAELKIELAVELKNIENDQKELRKQLKGLIEAGKKAGDKKFDEIQDEMYENYLGEIHNTLELARLTDAKSREGLEEIRKLVDNALARSVYIVLTPGEDVTKKPGARGTLDTLALSSDYQAQALLIAAEALAIVDIDDEGKVTLVEDKERQDAARENLEAAQKNLDSAIAFCDKLIAFAKDNLDKATKGKAGLEETTLHARALLEYTRMRGGVQIDLNYAKELLKLLSED